MTQLPMEAEILEAWRTCAAHMRQLKLKRFVEIHKLLNLKTFKNLDLLVLWCLASLQFEGFYVCFVQSCLCHDASVVGCCGVTSV
jgi:hypothetical protein